MRLAGVDELGLTVLFYCGSATFLFAGYVVYQFVFKPEEEKTKKMNAVKLMRFKVCIVRMSNLFSLPQMQNTFIQLPTKSTIPTPTPGRNGNEVEYVEPASREFVQALNDYETRPLITNYAAGDIVEVLDKTPDYFLGIFRGKKAIFPRSDFREAPSSIEPWRKSPEHVVDDDRKEEISMTIELATEPAPIIEKSTESASLLPPVYSANDPETVLGAGVTTSLSEISNGAMELETPAIGTPADHDDAAESTEMQVLPTPSTPESSGVEVVESQPDAEKCECP